MLKLLTVKTAIILALTATLTFMTLGLLGVEIKSSYIVTTPIVCGSILLIAIWRSARQLFRRYFGNGTG